MKGWRFLLCLNPHLKWDVEGLENLNKKNWYLLICNHHSWADIVVLCVLFRKHIPMNKYFLKQQLAWVPFIGLACWALDMPFMKRYSRSYLLRHPEHRGKDVEDHPPFLRKVSRASNNHCELCGRLPVYGRETSANTLPVSKPAAAKGGGHCDGA